MTTVVNMVVRRIGVSSEDPGASQSSLRLAFADVVGITVV